ncbi:MAG TPA: HtaA domain-containing protein [Conexibacter sp.]|nr:HtaA domain-containing protein [Conexibacter sp.]
MLALMLPAPRALATVTPISTGGLDWGVKQSFRAYITGPIAHGSIALGDGATQNPDGTFHFPLSSGSYDDATGATVVVFGGSVHFSGHDGQLDMTLSDLRVELTSDGARLLADLSSLPFPVGGAASVYPDTELERLDLTGVDPTIGGGTTSWAAIPGTLAPGGAAAFAGFYGGGTAFDPVTFSYTGTGGKPLAESWSKPGAPFFDDDDEVAGLGGIYRLFVDPSNDAIHVVSSDGVGAYDLDTLVPLASEANASLDQFAIAFDPETATVFADDGSGRVLRFRYDAGTGSYVTGTVDMAPARTLDYDPATDKLWAIGTAAPSPFFSGNPTVEVATRDGADWDVETYPTLDTGGRNIRSVARSSTGKLVATYGPILVSSGPPLQLDLHGSATLADIGSALVATDIPDTTPTAPAAGTTQGYENASAAFTGGKVYASEFGIGLASPRLLTLVPSGANPSGYAVEGGPLATGPGLGAVALDRDDGTLYAPLADTVAVYREGAAVASIPSGPIVRAVGGARSLYAASNATGSLTRWSQHGTAPTVVQQPLDRAVELPTADARGEATFSASASGTPTPTVRWQQRAPGTAARADVVGATAPTLHVEDVSRRQATVGRAGRATLATLRCRTGSCRVGAPRRVRLVLGGEVFWAKVLKPATLRAGRRGAVRAQLGTAARRALVGRSVTVAFDVSIRSGRQLVKRHLRVTLSRR